MKTMIWSAWVCSCLFAACTFSPDLSGLGACESDGSCKVEGCVCLGGSVCVPETKGDDPVGCIPCETSADCGESSAGSCYEMTCDLEKGACAQRRLPAGADCDDGSLCTENDACDAAGLCQGTAVSCEHLDQGCDRGECDAASGDCVVEAAAEGTLCEDGLICTVDDACDADGLCTGSPVDCSDLSGDCTEGVCDEVAKGCIAQATNEGLPCDDGDPCTSLDTCLAGICKAGPVDLDGDGDGFVSAECPMGTDCDDLDPAVHPGAPEETYGSWACADGVDNDCDGQVDRQEGACAPICNDAGWCWENPLPQGFEIYGLHGTSDDDLWAVGELGTILHHSGGAWQQVNTMPGPALRGVYAQAPGVAYAVGDEGTLLRYNGSNWGPDPASGVYWPLYGVFEGDGRIWAVGAEGLILKREGSSWSNVVANIDAVDLYAIGGHAPASLLIAGQNGEVLNYSNGAWLPLDPPTTKNLHAVFGTADGSAWLAGDGGTLLRYDAEGFSSHSQGQTAWRGLWGAGPGDLWAVGLQGALAHLQGGMAGVAQPFGARVDLHAIWGSAADSIWAAVGPMIAHFDGLDWSGALDMRLARVLDLWAVDDEEVYAAGCRTDDQGQCVEAALLRRKRGAFDPVPLDADVASHGALNAVHGSGPFDVWAVGSDGLVLHKGDSEVWMQLSVPTSNDLYDVVAFSPEEVWIVGAAGVVLHKVGGQFEMVDDARSEDFYAVWGSGPTDVWVAGSNGLVLRQPGAGNVAEHSLGEEYTIIGGYSPDPSQAWLVAGSGYAFHFENGFFNDPDPVAAAWLSGIDGNGADGVWVVGCRAMVADGDLCVEPAVLEMTGSDATWITRNVMRTPGSLNAVTITPGGQVWVGGDRGTVISKGNHASTNPN